MKNVQTLVDMRIAQNIKGVPHGEIKLVRGTLDDGKSDYALFVNDDYLGSIDGAINDQQAVLVGIGKIREMLAMLAE